MAHGNRSVQQDKQTVTHHNGCHITSQNAVNVVKITLHGIQHFEVKHNNTEKGHLTYFLDIHVLLDTTADLVGDLFVVHALPIVNQFYD